MTDSNNRHDSLARRGGPEAGEEDGHDEVPVGSEGNDNNGDNNGHADDELGEDEEEAGEDDDEDDEDDEAEDEGDDEEEEEEEEDESPALAVRKKRSRTAAATPSAGSRISAATSSAGGSKRKSRSKRARPSGRSFLDTEAVVGDDDDEEDEEDDEYDDDFIGEAEEAHQAERELEHLQRRRSQHPGAAFQKAEPTMGAAAHLASAIGNIERRYNETMAATAERNDTLEEEDLGEEGDFADDGYPSGAYEDFELASNDPSRFIPDSLDTKLWMVPLMKGVSERDIVISILNKFVTMRRRGQDLPIFSVFASEHVRGMIYVEAESHGKVIEALSGLRDLRLNQNLRMVPLKEMSAVFLVGSRQKKQLALGEIVRVRAGLFEGDLGQVVDIHEQVNRVTIRLIPRVDYAEVLERMRSNDKRKPFRKRNASNRPVPRFLDRDEIEARGWEVEPGPKRDEFIFDGDVYEETGYFLKRIAETALISGEDVRPTVTEMKTFTSRLPDYSHDQSRIPIAGSKKSAYGVGEKVLVCGGDLAGLRGTIVATDGRTLTLQPLDRSLEGDIFVPLSHVVKSFEIGDCVRAADGPYAGNDGLVTSIDLKEKSACVFCPTLGRPFASSLENLEACPNYGLGVGGVSKVGNVAVNELVQLSSNETGVVVHIDKAKNLSVLTTAGKLECIPLSRIATTRSSLQVSSLDCNQHPLVVNSQVTVQDIMSPHRSRTGRVHHIWKHRVFVKVSDQQAELENFGWIVVDSCQLRVTTAAGGTLASDPTGSNSSAGFNKLPNMRSVPMAAGRKGGFRGNFRGSNDGFLRSFGSRRFDNQRVRILTGSHKGKIAEIYHVDFATGSVRVMPIQGGNQIPLTKDEFIVITPMGTPVDDGGRFPFRGGGFKGRNRGGYYSNRGSRGGGYRGGLGGSSGGGPHGGGASNSHNYYSGNMNTSDGGGDNNLSSEPSTWDEYFEQQQRRS